MTPEPIRGWILFGMSVKDSERGLQSGELARSAGVSPDTLRHYERLGVLKEPPRTEAGYRLPPDALSRVLLIRNALAVGFSLDELTRILRLRDSGQAPCREVAEMALEKVSALDLQIRATNSTQGFAEGDCEAVGATLEEYARWQPRGAIGIPASTQRS